MIDTDALLTNAKPSSFARFNHELGKAVMLHAWYHDASYNDGCDTKPSTLPGDVFDCLPGVDATLPRHLSSVIAGNPYPGKPPQSAPFSMSYTSESAAMDALRKAVEVYRQTNSEDVK